MWLQTIHESICSSNIKYPENKTKHKETRKCKKINEPSMQRYKNLTKKIDKIIIIILKLWDQLSIIILSLKRIIFIWV